MMDAGEIQRWHIDSVKDKLARVELLKRYSIQEITRSPNDALAAAEEAVRLATSLRKSGIVAEAQRNLGLRFYDVGQFLKACECLERSIELYTSARDKDGKARALQNYGVILRRLNRNAEALHALEQSEALLAQLGNVELRATLLMNIGIIHSFLRNHVKAFEAYSHSLSLFEQCTNDFGLAVVSGNIGHLYMDLKDFSNGVVWTQRSFEFHTKRNDGRGIALTLIDLGSMYQSLGNSSLAHTHFTKSLTVAKQHSDAASEALALDHLSEFAAQQGNLDQALEHSKAALEIYNTLKDVEHQSRTLTTIGDIYKQRKKFAQALEYYQQAYDTIQRTDNYVVYVQLITHMAELHLSRKQRKEALALLSKGVALCKKVESSMYVARIHQLLSEVYEKEGNVTLALQNFKQFHKVQSEWESMLNSRAVQELTFRLDIEKAIRDREVAELQAAQLQAQLESKSAELNTAATALAKRNETVSAILQSIRELSSQPPLTLAKGMQEIIRDVEQQIKYDKDWKGLSQQIQFVQDDFITKLKSKAPNLSRTELNICSLLKLNLSSKEIADILFLSPQSVDVSRHRIRNKLNIGSTNLMAFFESI